MSSRSLSGLLFALAITAAACRTAAVEPAGPALDERFSLRAGESARIRDTPATLVFERVLGDSRCAIDVVCIQAGEARVAFRLEQRGAPPVAFQLDTDRERTAATDGYTVTLVSVLPAPRSTVRIDPKSYVVEVLVSRGASSGS